MTNSFARAFALAVLALLAWPQRSTAQSCADCIFANGFEIDLSRAGDETEAARFLTQATFGVTRSEIATVLAAPYASWIDAQLALPASLTRPAMEAFAVTLPVGTNLTQTDRIDRWFTNSITGPDQLRQRMAWALSQIVVASDVPDALSQEYIMMGEWQDLLTRNAFGNYRTLLEEVSLSPIMGRYLSHLRNRKKEGTTEPDENFAREVMQLFSIGLLERNRDFTPIDGNAGQPGIQEIPTYDQNIVTNLSRVLTGYSYQCNGGPLALNGVVTQRDCNGISSDNGVDPNFTSQPCTGVRCNFITNNFNTTPSTPAANGLVHPDLYLPMVCYPRYRDSGWNFNNTTTLTDDFLYGVRPFAPPYEEPYRDKRIVGFEPPTTLPPYSATCHLSVTQTSTLPTGITEGYLQTCVDQCNNELDNALEALFQHPNLPPFLARQLIQRFVTSNPTGAYIDRVARVFEDSNGTAPGGVRGDLGATIKAVLLDVEARQPPAVASFGKLREPLLRLTAAWRSLGAISADNRRWGRTSVGGQRPLGAATVFNFYEPDYQQPGQFSTAGLYSPEFQIFNETTAIDAANTLYSSVFNGYSTSASTFTQPTDRGYIPPANLDEIPTATDALIQELNVRLMYGSMSPNTRAVLTSLLNGGLAAIDHRRRVLFTTHLILLSPEFVSQR